MQSSSECSLLGSTTSTQLLVLVIANTLADRYLLCWMWCWLPEYLATPPFGVQPSSAQLTAGAALALLARLACVADGGALVGRGRVTIKGGATPLPRFGRHRRAGAGAPRGGRSPVADVSTR